MFEKDKNLYTIAHGILRIIIGEKLNRNPRAIVFSQNFYEKPFVDEPHCFFNLSHTQNFFCIAYSSKSYVGIDVEHFDRNFNWKSVAKHFFSENENNQINSALPNNQLKAFIAIWTRKEAVLKALGCGMVNNLKDIDSVSDIFYLERALFNDIRFDSLFDYYHLQTFNINEMIISISHTHPFSIICNEFKLKNF